MDFLPLFFNVKNKSILVVGGGEVASRKVRLLISAHAKVKVVAPFINDDLNALVCSNGGECFTRFFEDADIDGAAIVVAATDNVSVNAHVGALAAAKDLPVNVVDDPALCSFIFPAVIDRSPVIAAVSSGGKSPVLARLLRTRLESLIPNAYGELADLVGTYRKAVQKRFTHSNNRRGFWEQVLQGPIAELVFAGKKDEAEQALNLALDKKLEEKPAGEVYLVGAGPGDPDLLTFKAVRLMQQADVVLYDRLVSQEVRDLVRRDAKMLYVGKAMADHAVPQDEINELLVTLAKEGKRVLRLKGGDPFIFGRGGEEIDRLADAGVRFQVVPGITAAAGCSAYAGIPLTHRDYSQSVRFVTGHLKDGTTDLPWSELVHPNQTIVFYMGLTGINVICKELQAHGMSPQTPIALVQKGTTSEQKTVVGTIESMPALAASTKLQAPTLIIVGEVVSLRDKLNWFESDEVTTS
jgi:uroporphyrin-III C-methyltransferase/precorrin-2 dehydrogenase/sirohydrochlorin ferrochelatase